MIDLKASMSSKKVLPNTEAGIALKAFFTFSGSSLKARSPSIRSLSPAVCSNLLNQISMQELDSLDVVACRFVHSSYLLASLDRYYYFLKMLPESVHFANSLEIPVKLYCCSATILSGLAVHLFEIANYPRAPCHLSLGFVMKYCKRFMPRTCCVPRHVIPFLKANFQSSFFGKVLLHLSQ